MCAGKIGGWVAWVGKQSNHQPHLRVQKELLFILSSRAVTEWACVSNAPIYTIDLYA